MSRNNPESHAYLNSLEEALAKARAELAQEKANHQAFVNEHNFDHYEKLRAFKKYVHDRLDAVGVPADPEPENNAKHGCRIEGRLNYVLRRYEWAAPIFNLPSPKQE